MSNSVLPDRYEIRGDGDLKRVIDGRPFGTSGSSSGGRRGKVEAILASKGRRRRRTLLLLLYTGRNRVVKPVKIN